MYVTYIYKIDSSVLIPENKEKKHSKNTYKIIETYKPKNEIESMMYSVGYKNIKKIFVTKPYKSKKKIYTSNPFDTDVEKLKKVVKMQFEDVNLPYREYRNEESSDSDVSYEEIQIEYVSLVQNTYSKEYFIAIDPLLVKSVKQTFLPEFSVIKTYPVKIADRNTVPKLINLDCKTEDVALKGVDFHISRFCELKSLEDNIKKLDISTFLENKTENKEGSEIAVKELFDSYDGWRKKHNRIEISLKEFTPLLEQKGYEKKRISKGMVIKNLGFSEEPFLISKINDDDSVKTVDTKELTDLLVAKRSDDDSASSVDTQNLIDMLAENKKSNEDKMFIPPQIEFNNIQMRGNDEIFECESSSSDNSSVDFLEDFSDKDYEPELKKN